MSDTIAAQVAAALIDRYGPEAVCRMLDDAENRRRYPAAGPADVPPAVARRALPLLGVERWGWRALVDPDYTCRPM